MKLNEFKLHTLASDKEGHILIPPELDEKATQVVNYALESRNAAELDNKLKENVRFYVPKKVKDLINEKDARIIDEAYLSTCLHLMYDKLSIGGSSPEERYLDIQTKQSIERKLNSLN